jgi:hypothetical protein
MTAASSEPSADSGAVVGVGLAEPAWKALVAWTGVPAKRLHAAQHTALSLIVGEGGNADISVAQEISGHPDMRPPEDHLRGPVLPGQDLSRLTESNR